MGFKFLYNHTDDEINYDVFEIPHLGATVDHTKKELSFNLIFDDDPVNINSEKHLKDLMLMIASITIK